MTARLVVTLPPSVVGDDAIVFATRAKARGAELVELRTDLHGAGDLDVDRLAARIDLVVAERGAPVPHAWRRVAALVDRELGAEDVADATLVSLHAERPLSSSEALARWGAVTLGSSSTLVKHVEPLTPSSWTRAALREAMPRLMATRALLEQRFGAGRVTVLATGPWALPFRAVLAEGNALDYLALAPSWLAAAGQRLLEDAVRARRVASTSERLAILGTDLAGSRSPRVHQAPFDRVDLPEDAPLDDLVAALHPYYRGFAVTSPFKQRAARSATSDHDAVNTLVRTRAGYAGANTDVQGATAVLAHLRRSGHEEVTVLGDGGAAAALPVAASSLGMRLRVVRRREVSAPITGAVVWTWPARVAAPTTLVFQDATVAVIAYGAHARVIADVVTKAGGTPLHLGPRWFVAQARAQRDLWQATPRFEAAAPSAPARARATRVDLDATATKAARLVPPPSKSDAQRALTLAHVLGTPSLVALGPERDLPDDVVALATGLMTLRQRPAAGATIACGDGAAPLRILVGQAAVTPGARVLFTGSARLGARPHRPLLDALAATLAPAGLSFSSGEPWPLEVRGATAMVDAGATRFAVAARASSQHATSVLLAAAALVAREQRPWTVDLVGPTASRGYLDLTIAWLARLGFVVDVRDRAITIAGVRERLGDQEKDQASVPIPGDWSSIGYLALAAWRTGGTVAHVDLQAMHPDRALVQVLAHAGLALEARPNGDVAVVGTPRAGVRVSADECPDLLPTVAALACVLPAPSTLSALGVLRHKESDRVQGIEALVRAAGGTATLIDDALVITPGRVPNHLVVTTQGDHRLAMAAATLAVLARARLTVDDGACVTKSFPGFWRELERLHCVVTPEAGGAPPR